MTKDSDAALTQALDALASPTRLALMRTLRTPQAISEIRVASDEDGRPLARQTIRRHVDALVETGLVQERPMERARGETVEFIVQPQRIFVVSEQLKLLARLFPKVEPEMRTEPAFAPSAPLPETPTLVLVKGIDEGALFPLERGEAGRTWRIGRRRGVEVSLEYDPSVSAENARIVQSERGHVLEDIPGSLNGTRLNLRRLAPGERVALEHGDLLGVGRSLLLYWSRATTRRREGL